MLYFLRQENLNVLTKNFLACSFISWENMGMRNWKRRDLYQIDIVSITDTPVA